MGADDPRTNPFLGARLPVLRDLLGGGLPVRGRMPEGRGGVARGVAADATLGVAGRPQSGTGQTALLCGVNAPARYGRHFGPWVPTDLRDLLARENLLRRAANAGRSVAFANATPGAATPASEWRRPAAPPLAASAAGVLLRGAAELRAARAVASSITNEKWRARLDPGLPEVSPAEAGEALGRICAEADLTLFAHYDTDLVGHRGDYDEAVAVLERVDAFLAGVVESLPDRTLLVIASDHGNIEDATGGHTENPVPVLALGPGSDPLVARVRDITHVAPAILAALGVAP